MKIFQIQKLKIAVIALSLLATASCSRSIGYTQNNNSFIKRIVKEKPLANGKVIRIGYKEPDAIANCKYLSTQAVDMQKGRFSSFSFEGDYGVMARSAVEYSNQHPQDNVNYASLKVPDQVSSGNVYVDIDDHTISYYSCKNPPALHSNPFKD